MFDLVFAALLVAVPVPDRTPMPESKWVGKIVLATTVGVQIGNLNEQNQLTLTTPLLGLDYRVYAERGDFIQVKTREGVSGWLPKANAVLLEDAVAYFTKQIEKNPNDLDAFNRRGWSWKLKGEHESALKDMTEAIRLNPQSALFNNRALVWVAKKDYDQAIADYSQAINLDPQYALPYANRGSMWHLKKEYDKAIADFNLSLQRNANYAGAYRSRGLSWHAKKEYDNAITDFGHALRIDAKFAAALADRGRTWGAKKNYAEAFADLNEAHRLEPKNAYVVSLLALWLASCPEAKFRDGKQALELARAAHRAEPTHTGAMEALAAALAETGNFDEAVRWQQRALEDALLKNDDTVQRRLERYRKMQPYRQE